MFGFAIISVFFNLIAGLLLLSCLTAIINFVVHRSFKFQTAPNLECFGSLLGALFTTGILGTLWNLSHGANARSSWYGLFIHMPFYGSVIGGLLGKLIGEKILTKASRNSRRWLMAIAIAFALAALYSYIYTGAISYGDS